MCRTRFREWTLLLGMAYNGMSGRTFAPFQQAHGHAAQSTVASIAAADSARTSRKSQDRLLQPGRSQRGEGVQVRGEPIRYLRRPRELVQHRHRADPSGPCSEHEHLGQHGQLPGAADRADRSAGHIRRPLVVLTTVVVSGFSRTDSSREPLAGSRLLPPGRVELLARASERFPTRHFLRGLPTAALAIVDVGEDVVAKWGTFGLWRERESLLGKRDRFVEVGASVEIDLGEEDVSLCKMRVALDGLQRTDLPLSIAHAFIEP